MSYAFHRVTDGDLPMLRSWLQEPAVTRWWGDPVEQLARIEGDLNEPNLRQWIVSFDSVPFAYVQDWDPHAWPDHSLSGAPPGARGVDPFIGRPDMLGRGHGSAFLRLFAERLMEEGASCVLIDPEEANRPAVRAYEKAGFVIYDRHVEPDGGCDLLMRWSPEGTS